MMVDWGGRRDHCLDKPYWRHLLPPKNSIYDMLLQYKRGHKGTSVNTVVFKRPPLGPLLPRSGDKVLERYYMQLSKANWIKGHLYWELGFGYIPVKYTFPTWSPNFLMFPHQPLSLLHSRCGFLPPCAILLALIFSRYNLKIITSI